MPSNLPTTAASTTSLPMSSTLFSTTLPMPLRNTLQQHHHYYHQREALALSTLSNVSGLSAVLNTCSPGSPGEANRSPPLFWLTANLAKGQQQPQQGAKLSPERFPQSQRPTWPEP